MSRIDAIDDLHVFDAIARSGSLSAASRELGVSLTLVSKKLKRLEDGMGLRLVQRTTRQLSLTAEGTEFLGRCRRVLEAVAEAEEVGAADAVRGTVRVTAAVGFASRQLAPRLPRFLALYPEVSVHVVAHDALVDLVEQRVDVAFRQLPLGQSSLVTRTVAPDGRVLVAAPDYLARAGAPALPEDLPRHACLAAGDPLPGAWQLGNGERQAEVAIRPAVSGTDTTLAHAAALAGAGIALLSSWDAADDVRAGRLVRVLPGWWGEPRAVRVVLPVRAHQPPRVRALVAFMEGELKAAARALAELNLFPPLPRPAARAANDAGVVAAPALG